MKNTKTFMKESEVSGIPDIHRGKVIYIEIVLCLHWCYQLSQENTQGTFDLSNTYNKNCYHFILDRRRWTKC